VTSWNILRDAVSSQAFGEAVAEADRSFSGNTSLVGGLHYAARLLQMGSFDGARLIIDIARDHPSDGGQSIPVRDEAVAAGITINALPILADADAKGVRDIVEFYRRDIIGGVGAFVLEADGYGAFAAALKRKLLLEIAMGGSGSPPKTLEGSTD
jgi:hypothetical protein